MTEFTLGQKVTGGPRLIRRSYFTGSTHTARTTHRAWGLSHRHPAVVEGIFVGWRTYANGTVKYDSNTFRADEYLKVALIVTDARSNPIPVMFDTVRAYQFIELFNAHGPVSVERVARLPAMILSYLEATK